MKASAPAAQIESRTGSHDRAPLSAAIGPAASAATTKKSIGGSQEALADAGNGGMTSRSGTSSHSA
jgi:hypothetical protein